jgi:hypothetical protein
MTAATQRARRHGDMLQPTSNGATMRPKGNMHFIARLRGAPPQSAAALSTGEPTTVTPTHYRFKCRRGCVGDPTRSTSPAPTALIATAGHPHAGGGHR